MIDQIQWLGHGSFIIQGPPLIYINPWRITRSDLHADVILVSHDHYDHCSLADIGKLRAPRTLVIGNERAAREIEDCMVLRAWQSVSVGRACIKAIPAYSPDDWRHPASDGGLGFVISLNLYDIYYAGDTQVIPEMAALRPDVAILPIDGRGTMNVEEAAQVVRRMHPRWALPSNWGTTAEGASRIDALAFKRQVGSDSEVIIMQQTT
ncbi:MAG: MBL fold metallo-hydrolase [Anaerolineae bacterium]|nr:MBL fold metallo-hydrolase [Anaerolineae bacterium]